MILDASIETERGKLTVICSEEGWSCQLGEQKIGPFSEVSQLIVEGSKNFRIEGKKIYEGVLECYKRPISLKELNEILSLTIRRDEETKIITFLGMILAQTNDDQLNVVLQSESSTGKSYIPLEVSSYFPESDLIIFGGASPTSFFHESGEFDEERKIITINLEHRIMLFLDMPHWMLLEKLRPLLSHDAKKILYKITDRKERKGLLTKTVELIGYPSVFFCTAVPTKEEQETTRFWLLSPEADESKILEALNLINVKETDKITFRKWIEQHPLRKWLKTRVEMIRASKIREVIIPESEEILRRYLSMRGTVTPRDTREYPRVLKLIKGIALLNLFNRAKIGEDAIIAEKTDIEEAFNLYEKIAPSNECGIPPAIYQLYQQVIRPLAQREEGATRKEIIMKYFATYRRPLSLKRLNCEVLPALLGSGLVAEEPDPVDKRQSRFYLSAPGKINTPDT